METRLDAKFLEPPPPDKHGDFQTNFKSRKTRLLLCGPNRENVVGSSRVTVGSDVITAHRRASVNNTRLRHEMSVECSLQPSSHVPTPWPRCMWGKPVRHTKRIIYIRGRRLFEKHGLMTCVHACSSSLQTPVEGDIVRTPR